MSKNYSKINFPSFIEKNCNDKKKLKLLKNFYENPTIKNVYKIEDTLKIPLLKFVIGDVEYEGPKKDLINTDVARSIYPYINKFFDIHKMLTSSVNDYSFWFYINNFLINTKIDNAKDKRENSDVQN